MIVLFVRMLTLILQRQSRSIQTKEVCPPIIIAASPVTSNPNVHSSRLRSRRFRGSCQQKLHEALYLRRHIRLHGISSDNKSLFRPNKRRANQGASRGSRRSPIGVAEPNARYAKKNGQYRQDPQTTSTSQAGMG
jgi:hypothetical protein